MKQGHRFLSTELQKKNVVLGFRSTRLSWSLLLVLVVRLCVGQVSQAAQIADRTDGSIVVGANIQVSKSQANSPHFEVLIAADPDDPTHLLACSMWRNEKSGTIAYTSFDGARSWQETLRGPKGSGDPSCAFGPNGAAYVAILSNEMLLFKSLDSGKTWGEPIKFPWIDREYVTVDNFSSQDRGRVYLHGRGRILSVDGQDNWLPSFDLWTSNDSGEAFRGARKLAVTEPNHGIRMGNGVVLADGKFVGIMFESNSRTATSQQEDSQRRSGRLVAVSTRDNDQTLLPVGIVSDVSFDFGHRGKTCSVLPVLSVDHTNGPFKNRLYAAWSDLRVGRMAVLISYSSDTGKTWSSPVVVSDYDSKPNTLNPPDDCMPSIAVNSAGVVGVMWYDHRDSPDNTGYWPRFSASLDGGETFLPSVKVSEAPSSLAFVPSASSRSGNGKLAFSVAGVDEMQFNGGHTAGLTSSADGAFHPLWVDNRTGISQVWTAAVTVVSSSIATPLESSPALTNVTDRIALRLGRPIYEPAKHVIAFDARIENMSKEPLLGPIKLRFSSLSSRLGQISALKSDNRIVNGNAEWDFTNELKHGALKAGEWSGPKRLEFRLYVTPEAVRSLCIFCNLIDAEVMVLAP